MGQGPGEFCFLGTILRLVLLRRFRSAGAPGSTFDITKKERRRRQRGEAPPSVKQTVPFLWSAPLTFIERRAANPNPLTRKLPVSESTAQPKIQQTAAPQTPNSGSTAELEVRQTAAPQTRTAESEVRQTLAPQTDESAVAAEHEVLTEAWQNLAEGQRNPVPLTPESAAQAETPAPQADEPAFAAEHEARQNLAEGQRTPIPLTRESAVQEANPSSTGCFCAEQYTPVCSTDGKTYGNTCKARCAGIEHYEDGECKDVTLPTHKPTSKPSDEVKHAPAPLTPEADIATEERRHHDVTQHKPAPLTPESAIAAERKEPGPTQPCDMIRCPSGTTCVSQQVTCLAAPCKPVAVCMPFDQPHAPDAQEPPAGPDPLTRGEFEAPHPLTPESDFAAQNVAEERIDPAPWTHA